jgi:uncharacterized membrane protein
MVLATAGASRVKGAHSANENGNVGDAERVLSLLTGSALAVYGLRRRGAGAVGIALVGAELVRRGASGRCMVYEALGVTTADGGRVLPHHDDVTSRAATVNARRAIKIERTVTILRPREELYAFWRRFENLPRFMQHLESVTCPDDMHSHWMAKLPHGRTAEWDAEIVNDIEHELIAWKTVGDPDVAHAGSVHFRDAAQNRGTEVRIVFDYEPPGARLIGQVARALGHVPDALAREDLRRFKQLMETGELATVDGQASCR